jgi:hypothetical protein
MVNPVQYQRMLDRERKPSDKEILAYLSGNSADAWADIVSFLRTHYDFSPELDYGGIKYGWSVRYRKSGKSLCTLYPGEGAFTILIVLGKKEVEQFEEHIDEFSPKLVELFDSAKQFHDGRWLWIRILDTPDTEDVKRLLVIKRKPKNR